MFYVCFRVCHVYSHVFVAMLVLPTITTTIDFSAVYVVLAVLFTFIPGSNACNGDNGIILPPAFTYSWEFLLSCRDNANSLGTSIVLPHDLLRVRTKKEKIKKRGSKGGIKNRLRRWGSRYPQLVIMLSNVRSLNNKLDELNALHQLWRRLPTPQSHL